MELKHDKINHKADNIILLIVPYGIETLKALFLLILN